MFVVVIRSSVFVAVVVCLAAVARASDLPGPITAELIEIEHTLCPTSSTGYDVDFVRSVDFDGDGRADVVLDYGRVLCGGVREPFCTSEGCLLEAWRHEKAGWRKVFEGRGKSWSVGEVGGRRALILDGRPVAP